MKKTMLILALVVGFAAFGTAQAFALPIPLVDGVINPATEWDNVGFPFYLHVTDPNEVDVPDQYDIKSVTMLQVLGEVTGNGIYILIETYADPSLVAEDLSGPPAVTVRFSGDFQGDGAYDIFFFHQASLDGTIQAVYGCNPAAGIACDFNPLFWPPGTISGPIDLLSVGGSFAVGNVLEYYIPTGTYGTPPNTPFPSSFVGKIIYDGGGASADDEVVGSVGIIPEPGTMMLFGSALLGLLGIRFKK